MVIDYFIRIAYDGTAYRGWQRQDNHSHTIQQTVEELLGDALGNDVAISGCGRTDSGVHASQFYFYVGTPSELPENFLFFMNKKSPSDISFLEIIPVNNDAHVCLDASSRTYDYFFHDFPDVWLARSSSMLDLNSFQPERTASVLPQLLKHTDFREFCLTPDRLNSTLVDFTSITLLRNEEGSRYRIRFVANRFLRGMIRILIHDLLRIGKGELSRQKFAAMLAAETRGSAVRLAPPQGLFLTGVTYPYIERKPQLPVCGLGTWKIVT